MNLFEYIKAHISILDVVQEYVTLKPAGSYWKGFSPFKPERTPSFTVSPHKGIYYCFSTGNGGDVINFVSKIENCSALEAAQHLCQRFHLTIPEQIAKTIPGKETNGQQNYQTACSLFATWCRKQLYETPFALGYLQRRGLTKETIELFNLGYCPGGPQITSQFLEFARSNGLMAQQLIEAKIIIEGQHGPYIPFDDRIIFPIHDALGRVCGFGGRIFRTDDTRAKYYNSREHNYFNKKSLLYGFHQAKKEMQAQGEAYLVEGYMDSIAMTQAGYKNCIATLGTACTHEHLALLARHVQKVLVMYDGDDAGQNAIMRLAQLCWQVRLELFVLVLPKEEDPASYLSHHASLKELGAPQELFSFFINRLGQSFLQKSLQEKLATVAQFVEIIASINDPLQQNILLQQAAKTFDIPFNALKQEFLQSMHQKRSLPAPEITQNPIPDLEKKIFSVILNNDKVLNSEDAKFLEDHLSEPLGRLLGLLRENSYNFDLFFAHLSTDEKQVVSGLAVAAEGLTNPNTFQELMIQIQRKQWRNLVNNLKAQLSNASQSQDAQTVQKTLLELQAIKGILLRKGSS